ncbi:MAG: tripartite tricarboxylate transporter permease, partial [Treponema sp.]|nr:tripartite tricarboxylate transporter permease [Treponema sp.]
MTQIIIFFEEIVGLVSPMFFLALSASTILGIVVGALPGLTATMGLALLTGLTFRMPTEIALPILMGMYVGAMYAGSISGILLNIPGHGAAAASVLDGYPLAQRGEALPALWVTRIGSVIGTIFGMFCLAFFTPLISRVAENFSSPEYFLLALFGVIVCGSLSSPDKPIKGWIAGMLGMMVAFVGIEEIYGFHRFTFGNPHLIGGIPLVPVMIGLFGIPQIITTLRGDRPVMVVDISKNKDTFKIVKEQTRKNIFNMLRSGAVGVGVGAIPGAGEDISAWMSYDRAKKASKNPDQFGKGSYEGLIAAETANNSAIGGNLIPLLNLAVPGSAPTAVLLGALFMHNIRPGPALMLHDPRFVFTMTGILFWAAIALF